MFQGWLEIPVMRKLYKTFSPNKIDDSKKPTSEKALKRAEAEERRREKVRRFRRSLSYASHRHEYFDSNNSSNGAGNGSSRGGGSNQNPLLVSDYFTGQESDEDSDFTAAKYRMSPGSGLRKGAGGGGSAAIAISGRPVVGSRLESDEPSVAMSGVSSVAGASFSTLQSIPEGRESR